MSPDRSKSPYIAVNGVRFSRSSATPRHDRIDPSAADYSPDQLLTRVEPIKYLALISRLPPPSSPNLRRRASSDGITIAENHEPFFNAIGH